jgi:hypothetical protein
MSWEERDWGPEREIVWIWGVFRGWVGVFGCFDRVWIGWLGGRVGWRGCGEGWMWKRLNTTLGGHYMRSMREFWNPVVETIQSRECITSLQLPCENQFILNSFSMYHSHHTPLHPQQNQTVRKANERHLSKHPAKQHHRQYISSQSHPRTAKMHKSPSCLLCMHSTFHSRFPNTFPSRGYMSRENPSTMVLSFQAEKTMSQ